MTGDDWIEHRRGDRELLGWVRPDDDGFVVIDLLGRPRTAPLECLAAEEFLEDLGLERFHLPLPVPAEMLVPA